MSTLQGKWALVTGASSGLGVEFAKLFAERRANLVLVARRMEPMNRLAEELTRKHSLQIVVIGMDLSRPGAAAELKSDLDARGIAIGSLVNNAGYGMYGGFLDQKLEAISGMMRVNMLALTELTHIFGRDMVKRREGQILMLASLLGYQAVPGRRNFLRRDRRPENVAAPAPDDHEAALCRKSWPGRHDGGKNNGHPGLPQQGCGFLRPPHPPPDAARDLRKNHGRLKPEAPLASDLAKAKAPPGPSHVKRTLRKLDESLSKAHKHVPPISPSSARFRYRPRTCESLLARGLVRGVGANLVWFELTHA